MTTAIVVVDMQNGFVHPAGSLSRLGVEMVGREALITEYVDAPRLVKEHLGAVGGLLAGSWDTDSIDELVPQPGDVIVERNRDGAFLSTDLEVVLRSLGAMSLFVTGAATNVRVESTARATDMRGYTWQSRRTPRRRSSAQTRSRPWPVSAWPWHPGATRSRVSSRRVDDRRPHPSPRRGTSANRAIARLCAQTWFVNGKILVKSTFGSADANRSHTPAIVELTVTGPPIASIERR